MENRRKEEVGVKKTLKAALWGMIIVWGMAVCSTPVRAAEVQKTQVLKIGCVTATQKSVEIMKEALANTSYDVEVVVFNGNNLPAEALNAGNIDGLFCNSQRWMETFNKEHGTHLVMAFPYYFSYQGLYSKRWRSPELFPNNAKIVVANGLSNIDGALRILQNAGLIKLAPRPSEKGFYSILDIESNPKGIEILPSELTAVMSGINDVDGVVASAVIVQNSGVLSPKEHLALSSRETMTPQGLIVNEKNVNEEWVSLAAQLMQTSKYYEAFNEHYDGTFILYSEIDKYF